MDAVDRGLRRDATRGVPPARANGDERRTTARSPIGRGQTNSQPRTVAAMLRLLEVAPGQRVLDVGSGSGWTTALLAHLVGPTGSVLGVELEPSLVSSVRATWRGPSSPGRGSRPRRRACSGCRTTRRTTGSWSPPSRRTLPQQLVDQLADGGRLVIPVRGTMTLVTRDGDETSQTHHGSYRFVPLR